MIIGLKMMLNLIERYLFRLLRMRFWIRKEMIFLIWIINKIMENKKMFFSLVIKIPNEH